MSLSGQEPAQGPGETRGLRVSIPPGARVFLRPLGILGGGTAARAVEAGTALPLAGGPLAFTAAEVILREGTEMSRALVPLTELRGWVRAQGLDDDLDRLVRPRPDFGGLSMDRPRIMAILNVTPDSFSDGGDFFDHGQAIERGAAMLAAGADILDVGGESTRPGADPVAPEEEIRRVVPVVRHFAERGAVVSIDTRHARTMGAALEAGARIVNDVTALSDPDALPLVAKAGAPTVLMHMRGEPRTMQNELHYDDVATDVMAWLAGRIEACRAAGMADADLAVDYGIGFAKGTAHNLELIRATTMFHGFGLPVLVGLSRKGFIGRLSREEPPKDRIAGSVAAGLAAVDQGAQILRVHDVAETFQAFAMWRGLHGAG
ncbi:dihydropteroate synthase [Arenibaculum pallidiluteum]|uniref:dihydropteroate synthase n=1 Tax=Arenibaculum pallidiluteum TaxID=2812559 RepID=UPI001A974D6F|nr:dihydropteroate synthase [Arenibaculum pallidiluteum]